ncbi:MAG: precorrin-6y C5,15-methyltransferase (decarboxylating) subunit CbiE, partial [Mariprofundaceae bacterium]|nr:precorrin-6y C5,15-methyltransferase (decarboxylating) subunit CbiE [Mariprofundaceae bacterium]
MKKCVILGVLDHGVDGLCVESIEKLKQADVVIGATRTLNLFANSLKPDVVSHDLTGYLKELPAWIEKALKQHQSVVVLATGDPLCHGIANYLIKKIGLGHLEILPNVSALQLACARAGVSWQDAYICSVHTKDAGEWQDKPSKEHGLYPLFKACLQHRKVIVFTSPENNPARIARMLLSENLADDFEMIVAENLLQDDEKMIQGQSIDMLAQASFSDLNMVILQRKEKAAKPV